MHSGYIPKRKSEHVALCPWCICNGITEFTNRLLYTVTAKNDFYFLEELSQWDFDLHNFCVLPIFYIAYCCVYIENITVNVVSSIVYKQNENKILGFFLFLYILVKSAYVFIWHLPPHKYLLCIIVLLVYEIFVFLLPIWVYCNKSCLHFYCLQKKQILLQRMNLWHQYNIYVWELL